TSGEKRVFLVILFTSFSGSLVSRIPGAVQGHIIYVFFGSDHGGERGALLYGLIGTCRLNGIDPEAYLRHILSVLPEWPSNRVDELLPWNVVLTNK
ncbi:transposase domain-containing protein, partial [Escherichia coli]|uniref:transposase domain-containing protein n=2 Tax=Escherichia coli TaxID=562 RepID=UPI0021BA5BCB